eukprot:CAMPEP_0172804946 /NCGR_PEP_ID=MMETSP1075-20121228/5503_1 /TAXON_ID=2916 /ORGANISM="Ceratium fusus, Strain PA161109" /LENGTH=60 /DNA_ID=CAMNT_0013643605 /DNA_START=140 /DNA_END=319 /DNA_ORIENTATION=+
MSNRYQIATPMRTLAVVKNAMHSSVAFLSGPQAHCTRMTLHQLCLRPMVYWGQTLAPGAS